MTDTEKITINLSVVDLGQVDLLVEQGFYSNRSDLIRTAIRNQLQVHAETVKQAVVRKQMAVGVLAYDSSDLDAMREAGEMMDIRAVGMVVFGRSVSPDVVRATVRSIKVYGVVRARPAVKEALADRTR